MQNHGKLFYNIKLIMNMSFLVGAGKPYYYYGICRKKGKSGKVFGMDKIIPMNIFRKYPKEGCRFCVRLN